MSTTLELRHRAYSHEHIVMAPPFISTRRHIEQRVDCLRQTIHTTP
jgi:adenosylmethionine-8-amino-7-oxononanoate aminotransferase